MPEHICEPMQEIQIGNGILTVKILPDLGGKVTSILYEKNGFQAVACSQKGYIRPSRSTRFADADASGIDDAFPTILPCNFVHEGKKIEYLDHGEIWRYPFEVLKKDKYCAELKYHSDEYLYSYYKNIIVKDNKIIFQYRIENHSQVSFPCLWTMHGLMRYEKDMKIFYSEGFDYFENAQSDKVLGTEGRIYPAKNDIYDFTRVPKKKSGVTVKYYVKGKVNKGCCGFIYPTQQMKCTLSYDEKILPYLGVWITAGGFRGDYNCALEPSNGYYDGVPKASQTKSLYYLEAGNPLQFEIELKVEESK